MANLLKFGPEKKAKLLELLASGSRRGAAAKEVGISYERLRQVLHTDQELLAAVHEAEMQANQHVEDALFQAALSGNVTACQVWLYNRNPDRWADKRNVQVSGPGGEPLQPPTVLVIEVEKSAPLPLLENRISGNGHK